MRTAAGTGFPVSLAPRCVNLRAGPALADEPDIRSGDVPASGRYRQSNHLFQERHMKKLLAALIAGLFAVAGAAVAADAKKEEKKAEAKKEAKAEKKEEKKAAATK
jgi:hypothetical protein